MVSRTHLRNKMLADLENYARGIAETKAEEEAGKEDIRAITKLARSASLKLLSVMAVIRLDDELDNIEKTLTLALFNSTGNNATSKSKNLAHCCSRKDVDHACTEANRRNNNWLAMLALVVLGFNEFMTLLRNPLWLGVLFVGYLVSKASLYSRLGKTTALNILAGQLKPNLCESKNPPGWDEILSRLGGSKEYLLGIKEDKLKAVIKKQTLDTIKDPWKPCMRAIISNHNIENPYRVMDICEELGISLEVLSSKAKDLTDGDLQLVMIAETALKEADSYLFDEPSN
ncbi:unnamed protein product [Microthlaspi erraticum]|uniref:Sey1/RHD3-like three-helix bundle domain-containing protein n=1 Tax=Microthlaspi erraticum TaxID=1685480 RepID=A0A6D2HLF0_9BRAS|nr:unnamed protein product [Microthlaspi erraticum]